MQTKYFLCALLSVGISTLTFAQNIQKDKEGFVESVPGYYENSILKGIEA